MYKRQSCNRAVEATEGDFVLLNTDTEVPDNWIPRLFYPIWIDPRTASVTPVTCESHILGVPTPSRGTVDLVRNMGVEEMDALVSRIKVDMTRNYLTEGVGFCMAVSRKIWNEIGGFDAKTFGRGYGEEFDWCLRALFDYGYVHRFAQNLFVAHWHCGSFSTVERQKLMERNNPIAVSRHSEYLSFRNYASKYSRVNCKHNGSLL